MTIQFFDLYGLPADAYGEDIKKYSRIEWNKKTFQSLTSNVCGQYCIYFIVKRCQGQCMKTIVNSLSRKNDFRVFQFAKKRYGVNMIFRK